MKCIKCQDRGGFRDGFGRWRRCSCRRAPTKAEKVAAEQMGMFGANTERAARNRAEMNR